MFLTNLKRMGFSLTELMVVVAIVGILASIGIPMYTKYIKRARASEISYAFGKIKATEEAYFSEVDLYKNLSKNPVNAPGKDSQAFCYTDAACTNGYAPENNIDVTWGTGGIGCRLSDKVYFQYGLCSGTGTYVPTNCDNYLFNTTLAITSFLQGTNDSWYVIQARGDLDGDTTFSRFETVIDSSLMYKDNELE